MALRHRQPARNILANKTESVSLREVAGHIVAKWQDKLSGVDVWAEDHCEAMLMYVVTH